MKTFLEIAIVASSLILISCGNNSNLPLQSLSNSGMGAYSARTGTPFTSQASPVFYSGTTGSPRNNNASVPGTGPTSNGSVPGPATAPVTGIDLFGLSSSQNAVTDPQQCANRYNSYPRFSGNFQAALSELATCLNRVMISQNPNLFQQYQTLQQNSYAYYY